MLLLLLLHASFPCVATLFTFCPNIALPLAGEEKKRRNLEALCFSPLYKRA